MHVILKRHTPAYILHLQRIFVHKIWYKTFKVLFSATFFSIMDRHVSIFVYILDPGNSYHALLVTVAEKSYEVNAVYP